MMAAKTVSPQDHFEKEVEAIRSLFLYAIMRHHPGAVPVKGTSVYAIIHAVSLLFAPIYEALPDEARKQMQSLLMEDNEPPATEKDKELAAASLSEARSMVGQMIDPEKARKLGILPHG